MTTITAPWFERLAWLGLGIVLAAAAFFLRSPSLKTAGVEATAATDSATAGGSTPQAPEDTRAPECYLGVVLAREAVDVSPETDGLLEELRVRMGDRVEQGQLIARLDTEIFEQQLESEQANLQSAEARMHRVELEARKAQQAHERRQALKSEGLFSKEEKESVRFESEKAAADLDAAAAEVAQVSSRIEQLRTTLARTEIRAPFDGTVAQRYLDPGARARAGIPVVRLISSGDLLARFAVPPEEKDGVPLGTAVRVEIEALGRAFPAVVEQMAPEIDTASQMIIVEARLYVQDGAAPEISSGAVARVSIVPPDQPLRSCLPPP